MVHNTDDARDTFKFLKSQGIGQTTPFFGASGRCLVDN